MRIVLVRLWCMDLLRMWYPPFSCAFLYASFATLLILSLSHLFFGASPSGTILAYFPADQNSAWQKKSAINDGVSAKQHGHFLSGILIIFVLEGIWYNANFITTLDLTSSSSLNDDPTSLWSKDTSASRSSKSCGSYNGGSGNLLMSWIASSMTCSRDAMYHCIPNVWKSAYVTISSTNFLVKIFRGVVITQRFSPVAWSVSALHFLAIQISLISSGGIVWETKMPLTRIVQLQTLKVHLAVCRWRASIVLLGSEIGS